MCVLRGEGRRPQWLCVRGEAVVMCACRERRRPGAAVVMCAWRGCGYVCVARLWLCVRGEAVVMCAWRGEGQRGVTFFQKILESELLTENFGYPTRYSESLTHLHTTTSDSNSPRPSPRHLHTTTADHFKNFLVSESLTHSENWSYFGVL